MVLTIELAPEMEQRLVKAARKRGQPAQDYARAVLEENLESAEDDRPELEADMQTVFSRPWTRLFVQSHKDKEVADRDTVGHRGTPIGKAVAFDGSVAAARHQSLTHPTIYTLLGDRGVSAQLRRQ